MIVHVQPVSLSSRRNLLAPARPVAVRARPVAAPAGPAVAPAVPPAVPAAAPGHNFVWRNFRGIEENPNGEKPFLGDAGPSREANAANSSTEHFNLFVDRMSFIVSAWKLTGMPIKIELLVFKMLDQRK